MKEQILTGIKRFVKEKVEGDARWKVERKFPVTLLKELGSLGYLGLHFPKEVGGQGLPFLLYGELLRELTKGDTGFALGVYCHTSLGLTPVAVFGTREQQSAYLEPGLRGEKIGALGLAESDAGSDLSAMRLKAVREGEGWSLSGSKLFCTNGTFADFAVVGARTENGISLFIADKGTFKVSKSHQTIGFLCAETAELVFEESFLPERALLGQQGKGLKQILTALTDGRVAASFMAQGLAEKAFELALNHVKTRVQFGRPLFENQAIQFLLAEMKTKLLAAESLNLRAASSVDRKDEKEMSASCAKLFSTQVATWICERACHLHGGYGFLEEYPVSQLYRDCKLLEVGEGTSEIHKMVVARSL